MLNTSGLLNGVLNRASKYTSNLIIRTLTPRTLSLSLIALSLLTSVAANAVSISSATFSPNTVNTGGTSTLTWNSTASYCHIDGVQLSKSGTKTYTNLSASKTVNITCSRPPQMGGGSASTTATVTVTLPAPSSPSSVSVPSTHITTVESTSHCTNGICIPTYYASTPLTWPAVPGVVSHYIAQKSLNNGSWSSLYTGTATNRTAYTLTLGSWRFRVKACNTTGCSGYTYSSYVTVQDPLPSTPSSLSITPTSTTATSVSATWGLASGKITRYETQRQLESGNWSTFYSGTSRTAPSSAMTVGSWHFRVRACNNSGCSAYKTGNTVTIKHPIPGQPTSLAVSPTTTTDTHVTASWGAASGHITRYETQRQLGSGSWSTFYSGTSRSATSSAMSVGSWHFRVRACNNTGCSAYRTGNTVTLNHPIPGASPSLAVSPTTTTDTNITANWSAASGHILRYETDRKLNTGEWNRFYTGSNTSAPSNNMAIGTWHFRVRACNNSGCSAYKTGNTVTINHPIPSVNTVAELQPVTVAGTMPYTAATNSMGDAEIRIPITLVPGVNGHHPKLTLSYNSNRLRKLVNEGWEEDNLGTGWRIGGLSAIRECSKYPNPDLIHNTYFKPMCLDGQLFIENDPEPIHESGENRGEHTTPWWEEDHEFVLWDDNGIKIRSTGEINPGVGGKYTVYYPDGSVSEYGYTDDSILHQYYVIWEDDAGNKYRSDLAGHSHQPSEHYNEQQVNAYVYRINKHTDAFGNEIHYEYYKDENRDFVMPKRITYGPKTGHDVAIDFAYQIRTFESGSTSSSETFYTPPVTQGANALSGGDYIDWYFNDYVNTSPVAINTITVNYQNQPVREYHLIHEQLQSGSKLARLKYVQQCAYKNASRDCLTPLTLTWDGSLTSDDLTRITEVNDNQNSWVQFDYNVVDANSPNPTDIFFTDSPFGAPPTIWPSGIKKPEPEVKWNYQEGDWEPSVITEMRTSNGLGSHNTKRYRYLGEGIESTKGFGFMGYHAIRIEDVDQHIFTYQQYSIDHRFIGRQTAEQVRLGSIASGTSQLLAKNYSLWAATNLIHGQRSWLNSQQLIQRDYANSHYTYAKNRLTYSYEEGQLIGVLVNQRTPEFAHWQNGPDTDHQYPFIRATSINKWYDSVTVSNVSSNHSDWGKYTISNPSDVLRSKKVTTQYSENRHYNSLQVAFPQETTTQIYNSDTTGIAEHTITERRTPYNIHGTPHSLVGTHTQFADDPNLEITTSTSFNNNGLVTETTVSAAQVSHPITTRYSNFTASRYAQTISNALDQSIVKTFDITTGNETHITDQNNQTTITEYDAFSREIRSTTPLAYQYTVTTQYDLCSQLATCPTIGGITTHSRVTLSSPIAPNTYQYLDGLGRELRVETTAFDGIHPVYLDTHYDPLGRVQKKTLPYFQNSSPKYIEYHYDALNRLIATHNPDGSIQSLHYGVTAQNQKVITRSMNVFDSTGNTLGSKTNKTYFNALGEIEKTTDAHGTAEEISTEFTFYATGLTQKIDVGGNEVARFQYDPAGNRTQLIDTSVGTITDAYNGLGQVRYSINNQQQRTDTTYDILGRPLTQTTDDGIQTWHYDPATKIGGVDYSEFVDNRTGYAQRIDYTYENNSRYLSGTTTRINIPNMPERAYYQYFDYDHYGRSKTVTFPSGIAVTSTYKETGYLKEVRNNRNELLQHVLNVDELGNVSQLEYGNGITSARIYNPLNSQLESVFTHTATHTIQNLRYQWQTDGLMESRTNLTGGTKTETFAYDPLSRLTASNISANGLTRSTQTHYALNGNITQKTATNSAGNEETNVTGYQYGTTEHASPYAVSQVAINGVSNTLHYNANGAITHYDAATGADKYVDWTARGKPWRITKGTSANDTTADARDEFAYGINGMRYYKKSTWKDPDTAQEKTEITFYIGHYEDLLPANNPDYSRVERTHINSHIMDIRTSPHIGNPESKTEFLHKDHLGSIETITDISGNILLHMSFDAFGSRRKTNWIGALSQQETEALLAQIGIGTSRGFTGHEHLDRTGLIHMNGRVYDPTLGRFLSADPYVQAPYFSQSYNRYTYTFNNPLIFNDPSGYLADENVNESSKETEDRKEKEKPEKPKPEPQKKTPEKEAKEKAKDEAKKEETGDEEKADDKNECYDSAFCYHIAGDDLSKPGSSEKKEGEDTSKKKKGDVDGKGGDKQESDTLAQKRLEAAKKLSNPKNGKGNEFGVGIYRNDETGELVIGYIKEGTKGGLPEIRNVRGHTLVEIVHTHPHFKLSGRLSGEQYGKGKGDIAVAENMNINVSVVHKNNLYLWNPTTMTPVRRSRRIQPSYGQEVCAGCIPYNDL